MMESEPEILIIESFAEDPEGLFEKLVKTVRWDERMKARKTASFGVSYDYSGMKYEQNDIPHEIDELCKKIYGKIGFLPNNCLLNYYENGNSSMGFHSDSSEELREGTGVAIISIGAERKIVYKEKENRSNKVDYWLRNGSLLYMESAVQEKWLHAIPKMENVGERISLTFRSIIK